MQAGGDVVIESEQMPDNDFGFWVIPEVFNQLANCAPVVEVNEDGQTLLFGPTHDSFEVFGTHPKALPTLVELEPAEIPLVVEALESAKIPELTQRDPMKRDDPVGEFLREPVDMFIARSDMSCSARQSDNPSG